MGIRISEMEEATTFGADDYVPIVTNGTNKKALGAKIKNFIAGFFISKSGDTMTGDLNINSNNARTKYINPNMTLDTSANNGLSSDSSYGAYFTDKNGNAVGDVSMTTRSTGRNYAQLMARNKKTDGTSVANYIDVIADKDGSSSYFVSNPAAFRNSIGLDYSVTTQTYDGLTWTIVKMGNLYDLYTEITIPANTNAITWGSIYVYRNPNKSYYSLPVALTKKIIDVSCMDGSSDGFPVFYTNISSVYNSATTADVGHPKTTTRAFTVRKYIRGYVS